jgi:hypothetical protein
LTAFSSFKSITKSITLSLLSIPFWIQAFDINNFDGKNVFNLGSQLIEFPAGIHLLEPEQLNSANAIIGIHGSNSEGYEWIYPLWKLNSPSSAVYFYRWNDRDCANTSTNLLADSLKEEIKSNPELTTIKLLAHSYGGLHLLHSLNLIEELVKNLKREIDIEIHFIASLLSPPKLLAMRCGLKDVSTSFVYLKIYNWQTIQEIDGAFRGYKNDPQELSLPNIIQTRLPETYNGRKLGHNWSISWVAEQL